jgi:antitoxin CcdA
VVSKSRIATSVRVEVSKPSEQATPVRAEPVEAPREPLRRAHPLPRRAVTLQLSERLIGMAETIGADLSERAERLLGAEIEREYWRRWNTDNAEAIAHYNARIEREGLFSDRYRTFMRPDKQS